MSQAEERIASSDKAEVIAAEQGYFDVARDHREGSRLALKGAPAAGAHKGAAAGLNEQRHAFERRLRPSDEAPAFGRIDLEDGETYYIGYNAIFDDASEALVVNWKVDLADPFFEASHEDSMGVALKREFHCDSTVIQDFEDSVFSQILADITRLREPDLSDALLEDLERHRTGDMLDIVRTIRASQHAIMRADLDQLLIIQGGPGTGKTAVGLHRLSWLLYRYQDRLNPKNVLVIGPSRGFVRYIKGVLPSLGDDDVRHVEMALLYGDVRASRLELGETSRLKGELRMKRVCDRALRGRVVVPDETQRLTIGGQVVFFSAESIASRVSSLNRQPYSTARRAFRDYVRLEAARQLGVSEVLDPQIDNLVDRVYPQLTAPSFLRDLLGSKERLLEAAGEDLSGADIQLLYRQQAPRLSDETWSESDLPLLDYAESLIQGETETPYEHIVVDEAQDLSPMQLLMIRRRSVSGSMTILGDLAQSTGLWPRDSWTEVSELLGPSTETRLEELSHGYRVPRQIFEVAASLLPYAAPHVSAPTVVRDGPSDPDFVQTTAEFLGAVTVEETSKYAGRGHSVGVICPPSRWEVIEAEFNRNGVHFVSADEAGSAPITLLTPEQSKGLEFDSVVVVEPEAIAGDDLVGLRLLYVALTRPTRSLSIVHSGKALPVGERFLPLGGESTQPSVKAEPEDYSIDEGFPKPENPLLSAAVDTLADNIIQMIPADKWSSVLRELSEKLGLNEGSSEDGGGG